MNLTVVLIIFGTVISILLFILIKKMGNSSQSQSFPTFPNDGNGIPEVNIPTIAPPPPAQTMTRPINPTDPSDPSGGTPTTTTSDLPPNSYKLQISGILTPFSTSSSTLSPLLQPGLSIDTAEATGDLTPDKFTFDFPTGTITGNGNPNGKFYKVYITFLIKPIPSKNANPTVPTFPNGYTFSSTVGIGLPPVSGSGIVTLPTGSNIDTTQYGSSKYYWGNGTNFCTKYITQYTKIIPYIYITDPKGLLDQSDLYIELYVLVREFDDSLECPKK